MPLADKLSPGNVLSAIADFDGNTVDHTFDDSSKFDMLHDGRRFPPKVIAALATRHATGRLPVPSEFTGGAGTKCLRLLRQSGFRVVPKLGLIPFDVGHSYSRKRVGEYLGTDEDTTKGDWATGYHFHQDEEAGIRGWWFLFPTVGAEGRTGHEYSNEWISKDKLRWEGRTASRLGQPQINSLLSGTYPVLLFSRPDNRAEFTYRGLATAVEIENTMPVRVVWSVEPTTVKALNDQEGGADEDEYSPSDEDRCERVLREIRARRGQQGFRAALMKAFDGRCVVTGCDVLSVLEAAHIRPYRRLNDNHSQNGLLLRSDVHTLFDLNLLGIEPETKTVRVHPSALRSPYDQIHGLALPANPPLSYDALILRWQEFLRGLSR